jgi:hypothetical protein
LNCAQNTGCEAASRHHKVGEIRREKRREGGKVSVCDCFFA